MIILIAIISILAITGLVWLANKGLPVKICPICAGVSGTWLLFTAAILAGADETVLLPPILILMGGSVVGIAYQGERSLRWAARHPLLWKVIVIGVGVSLAFWAANSISIETFSAEIVILGIVSYLFFIKADSPPALENKSVSENVRKLEEEMKNCC